MLKPRALRVGVKKLHTLNLISSTKTYLTQWWERKTRTTKIFSFGNE